MESSDWGSTEDSDPTEDRGPIESDGLGARGSGVDGLEGVTQRRLIHREEIPRSLRIVAFLFILGGVLSAVDMAVMLVVGTGVTFSLGVLGIFIGRGLLRLRDGWRKFALFCTVLELVCFGSLAPVAVWAALGSVPGGFYFHGIGSPWFSALFVVALAAYTFWQYYILRRRDVVDLCQAVSQGHAHLDLPPRFQFRLSTLLLAMVVAAFVFQRVTDTDVIYVSYEARSQYSIKDGIKTSVSYRYRQNQYLDRPPELVYALFVRGPAPTDPRYKSGSSSRGGRITSSTVLHEHDELPAVVDINPTRGGQILQLYGGQLQTTHWPVTSDEFEAYLQAVQPEEWSIDSLQQFCHEYRRGSAK